MFGLMGGGGGLSGSSSATGGDIMGAGAGFTFNGPKIGNGGNSMMFLMAGALAFMFLSRR